MYVQIHTYSPTYATVSCWKVLRKTESIKHQVIYNDPVHTVQTSWNPNFNTVEPNRPQHNHLAVCFIAHHYSSVTSVCRFTPAITKLARISKILYVFYFFFLNCVGQKLRNLQLRKLGKVIHTEFLLYHCLSLSLSFFPVFKSHAKLILLPLSCT